jgi:hypothetical protein
MSIDPYSSCPGGTGKKIKFCCAELIGDLEQLDKLTNGEQYAAALAETDRLLERNPGRACLLSMRTRLQLATRRFDEAAATSLAFVTAFPENPVALGQSAVCEALSGRVLEAAAQFDKAREFAGAEPPVDLLRAAQTLVQAGAQTGHPGFAQGIVEWLEDRNLGTAEERRMLAAIVGAGGVPPALRTKMPLEQAPAGVAWGPEFAAAAALAGEWRLGRALAAFHALKGVAGDSPELHANIGILCELLARPFEAAEAWLAVARLRAADHDDTVEATGRAIALETQADPDRSPVITIESLLAPLIVGGEVGGIELLEDKLRHDGRFEAIGFDRAPWVQRGAAPPRSVWRVYGRAEPQRLLGTVMLFGRQTDREPQVVLQGFEPDVAEAKPGVEEVIGCTFAPSPDADRAAMPATTPTNWLESAQFRVLPGELPREAPAAEAASAVDALVARQRDSVWNRFLALWPDTPLPELLGLSPRQAVAEKGREPARRVEAIVGEREATARQPDAAAAWAAVRERLGLPAPGPIRAERPVEQVQPLRWHRVTLEGLDLEQLRLLFLTSLDAGFDLSATRAAEAIIARPDAGPEDRWEAYGLLEERAPTSGAKLEIIGKLREIARELKASDGMLDVAELRVRLSRADEAGVTRVLAKVQRDHGRDQKVLSALASVLAEAGIDLTALSAQAAAARVAPGGAAAVAPLGAGRPAAEAGKIWTPGGEQPGQGGEKKSIWTPG